MSLHESDISHIETIIKQQLTGALDTFLKESVAPMVSGATKRALSESPQITEKQVADLLNEFKSTMAPDPQDIVNQAVNRVMEKLISEDSEPAPSGGVDIEAITAAIEAKLGGELEKERKLLEAERRARAEAEYQNKLITRNQRFTAAMVKSGRIAPDVADVALDIALKKGYIVPSKDEASFEVEERDRLGLGMERKPALEKLEEILAKPELQYFRPARAGTGTGATVGQRVSPGFGHQLQILPGDDPDSIPASELLRAYERGDGAKIMEDLRQLSAG